jgi:hypothetical protein
MSKHADKYNIKGNVDCLDNFREHYSHYNDEQNYKSIHFRTQDKLTSDEIKLLSEDALKVYSKEEALIKYNYIKRNRIGGFFWTMAMISDFMKVLGKVKRLGKEYRQGDKNASRQLKITIGNKLFKPIKLILDLKTHKDYMYGYEDEIIVGHPYSMKFDTSGDADGILQKNGNSYITDTYNNEIIGRKLVSSKNNFDIRDSKHLRGQFLNQLQGVTIDGVSVEEDPEFEIDAW